MKCPRCVQSIHHGADACPHCGFTLTELDSYFAGSEPVMQRLSDVAGAVRVKERKHLRTVFKEFEKIFPQLYFVVHVEQLEPEIDIQQYAFWLLNRGTVTDLARAKSSEGGTLLLIDVSGKALTLSWGYLLDDFLNEEITFSILSKAHPFLLQGQYAKGIEVVLRSLMNTLRRSRAVQMVYEAGGEPVRKLAPLTTKTEDEGAEA